MIELTTLSEDSSMSKRTRRSTIPFAAVLLATVVSCAPQQPETPETEETKDVVDSFAWECEDDSVYRMDYLTDEANFTERFDLKVCVDSIAIRLGESQKPIVIHGEGVHTKSLSNGRYALSIGWRRDGDLALIDERCGSIILFINSFAHDYEGDTDYEPLEKYDVELRGDTLVERFYLKYKGKETERFVSTPLSFDPTACVYYTKMMMFDTVEVRRPWGVERKEVGRPVHAIDLEPYLYLFIDGEWLVSNKENGVIHFNRMRE